MKGKRAGFEPKAIWHACIAVLAMLAIGTGFAQDGIEREGYFVADRFDHSAEQPVFNKTIGLRDTWNG